MSLPDIPPPPTGESWKAWAERLNTFMARAKGKLSFKDASSNPSQDGVLLWDRVNEYPVVSKNSEWRQIVLADGEGFLYNASDITASASNTAEALEFSIGVGTGISLGDSPNQSRIYFDEGGTFNLSFTAQIYSTNSSAVTFYFFPKINGVTQDLGATRATLSSNGQTMPVTKSAIFSVNDGDYLEAFWAVSDHTSTSLKAFAATAFAPAAPSVSLSIARVRG